MGDQARTDAGKRTLAWQSLLVLLSVVALLADTATALLGWAWLVLAIAWALTAALYASTPSEARAGAIFFLWSMGWALLLLG